VALWASNWFPGVVSPAQRAALLKNLYDRQRADGGWSLTDLGTWKRVDDTALDTRPDGYATGLVVLVLEESAGNPQARLHAEVQIERGRAWLKAKQTRPPARGRPGR